MSFEALHRRLIRWTFLFSCTSQPALQPDIPDSLTSDEAYALDQISSANLPLEAIVLPNGLPLRRPDALGARALGDSSLESLKLELISRMLFTAWMLADRPFWVEGAGSEGADQPNGLAYSFGAKDPFLLIKPPPSGCPTPVRGLDCSGMLYQIATNAGVNVPVGTAEVQTDPASWDAGLPDGFHMMALAEGAMLESGDVVAWVNSNGKAKHIGIIATNAAGIPHVYQSNGAVPTSCTPPCQDECAKNRGAQRGPRDLLLSEMIAWPSFGEPKKLLRIGWSSEDAGVSMPGTETPDSGGSASDGGVSTPVTCPAPEPHYQLINGVCVPSCGVAGGTLCNTDQCADRPLLQSWDCTVCC